MLACIIMFCVLKIRTGLCFVRQSNAAISLAMLNAIDGNGENIPAKAMEIE